MTHADNKKGRLTLDSGRQGDVRQNATLDGWMDGQTFGAVSVECSKQRMSILHVLLEGEAVVLVLLLEARLPARPGYARSRQTHLALLHGKRLAWLPALYSHFRSDVSAAAFTTYSSP